MRFSPVFVLSLALVACESETPHSSGEPDAAVDAPASDGGGTCGARGTVNVPACASHPGDYTPRVSASAGTIFPSCISDGNTFIPVNADVPSNARIAAFEQLAALLKFDSTDAPTSADFENARVLYTQPEGLDSRVARREDIHFPGVDVGGKTRCQDLTAAEVAQFPDRCAGPAKVVPLLNDAFTRGIAGDRPKVQAARIEAAMIWFMWLSLFKESQGCYSDNGQCDSTSAYWGGQQDIAAAPLGYGRYVKRISDASYRAGWDAVLAIRCAYDLQLKVPQPSNLSALKAQAKDQVDRVNNHALALILRERLTTLPCDASAAFVEVLGPVLDVVARAKDPAKADALRTEVAAVSQGLRGPSALNALLEEIFGCP